MQNTKTPLTVLCLSYAFYFPKGGLDLQLHPVRAPRARGQDATISRTVRLQALGQPFKQLVVLPASLD